MRLIVSLFIATLGLSVHSIGLASGPAAGPDQEALALTPVSDFQLIQPDLPMQAAAADGEFSMMLEGWGEQFQLVLEDNPRLLEQLPSSRQNEISARGDRFLSGTLAGRPDSWVRLNWIGGQLSGAFFDGSDLYVVDSAEGFDLPPGRKVKSSETVLMRYSDLELDGLFDHGPLPSGLSAEAPGDYREFVSHLREFAQTEGLTLLSMPVTLVADTFFEDDLGANAESTAIGRLNFVDGIFSDQLGVGIVLWHYEQLNDNGPLTATDSGELLSPQFRGFMRTGAGSDIPFRGLAHLFTGRDMDGSTVGRAYLNVLCSRTFGYGINQNLNNNTTSALVFAHELGHNYSADHVSEGIMRATIGGSQEFADESVDVMSAAVARASCLVDGGLRVFDDGFE